MALTKLITRAYPRPNHTGLHLLFKDDDETIIDRDYMEQWDGSPKMSDKVRDKIIKRMQDDVDAHKKLKTRFDDVGDDTAVTFAEASLKI